MTTITDLEKEIAEKTAKLEELKKAEAQLKTLGPEYQLAIQLHNKFCRWNHTDGCSWHYEISNNVHDWNRHAHKEWLKKSKEFLKDLRDAHISEEVAFKVFEIFKKI